MLFETELQQHYGSTIRQDLPYVSEYSDSAQL
jgi:hypothetical protein